MTKTSAPRGAMARVRSTAGLCRFVGTLKELEPNDLRVLLDRAPTRDDAVFGRAAEIISRVRDEGDSALYELARELDGASLEALEVPRHRCQRALDALARPLRQAMERAAENIRRVHAAFVPRAMEVSPEPGIIIGRRPDPLGRVGVYAPGGRAAYPSSVLMGAIPARVAGVGDIVLCTPPAANGQPSELVLAAAALAGVNRVFAIGGAGAIAAMAYGTDTVPRVDRVIGPGNAYVAAAKLLVADVVAIDSPAGPSELLVIADDTSDPELVARELLAQAEHDPDACVVAVLVGAADLEAYLTALERGVSRSPRRTIVQTALRRQGALLSVETYEAAIDFSNRYAPEHLLLALSSDERCVELLAAVRNVGTVFVGESSSNTFGDYLSGANHVLPTGGLARSYGGLSTLDFVRWTTYQRIDRQAARRLASDAGNFAEAEGLPGHAEAARAWATAPNGRESDGQLRAGGAGGPRPRAEVAILPLLEAEGGAVCEVDVSDNTNLWGVPPAAAAALRAASPVESRYPAPYTEALKTAIRDYLGQPSAGIVTGCGSDDILDLAMRAFGAPGDAIAFAAPTFSMVPVFAQLNGLVPIGIPLLEADSGYDIDAERLVGCGARIIYLCAPNNPTGTQISREALEHVIEHASGLIILDEAYAEFARSTNEQLVQRCARLLVARTFSKAFGLAGLRVGYGVGQPALVDAIERARGPYKVNVVAERAAIAALGDSAGGRQWVLEHAALARDSRHRLTVELRQRGLESLPSDANFVLIPIQGARHIALRMEALGVRVRVHTQLPTALSVFAGSNGEAIRISVGPWPMMERVLDALDAVLA